MTKLDYQAYLLVCLGEECAEIAQLASKCIRFGAYNIAPGHTTTNVARLNGEVNDLMGVLQELSAQDIDTFPDKALIDAKVAKIKQMYELHFK